MKTHPFAALGAASLLAMLAVAAAPSSAQAQAVQAGRLTCEVSPGTGLLVTSRKDVTCSFQDSAGFTDVYDGAIRKYGLDIGTTDLTLIVWDVFAPSGLVPRGALAGRYVGGTAQATLGAGIGANALIGGSRSSITLQPLSVSASTGFNLAAGAADLTLAYRVPSRPARTRR